MAGETFSMTCVAPLGNDLFAYVTEEQGACARSSRRQATYYVSQYGDLLLSIACSDRRPNSLGCKLRFPFEGFGIELTFHSERLSMLRPRRTRDRILEIETTSGTLKRGAIVDYTSRKNRTFFTHASELGAVACGGQQRLKKPTAQRCRKLASCLNVWDLVSFFLRDAC
jgi:hypothetical protein